MWLRQAPLKWPKKYEINNCVMEQSSKKIAIHSFSHETRIGNALVTIFALKKKTNGKKSSRRALLITNDCQEKIGIYYGAPHKAKPIPIATGIHITHFNLVFLLDILICFQLHDAATINLIKLANDARANSTQNVFIFIPLDAGVRNLIGENTHVRIFMAILPRITNSPDTMCVREASLITRGSCLMHFVYEHFCCPPFLATCRNIT